MAIPKEILEVERPKNTVVKATRKENVYSVVKRTSKRVPGKKNPVPVEIGVIGKIIDGVYIPNPESTSYEVDVKTYGDAALCDSLAGDLYRDLLGFFSADDAARLYCMAVLRTICPGIVDRDIASEYSTSYLSEIYPDVCLSRNTISSFLERIGKGLCTIEAFLADRMEKCTGGTVVIDGMLKNNRSDTNSFAEFSRKSRTRGTEDINIIYAYDIARKEPLAFSVYAGNMLDYTACRDFINTYPVEDGFIMMDKGFNDATLKEIMESHSGMRYLLPIKNSLKIVGSLGLAEGFTDSFRYDSDHIRCKKVMSGNRYYYAFKSADMEAVQRRGYICKGIDRGSFSEKMYEKKSDKFGLIVFESNADLNLEDVYSAYMERWDIEIMFNNYKNIVERQEVNVQGDYRMYSTEFINFLSLIISMRIKKKLKETGLNEKYSQRQVMRYLSKCMKRRKVKKSDEWIDCARLKYIDEICTKLNV